jgi:hypothetical protein
VFGNQSSLRRFGVAVFKGPAKRPPEICEEAERSAWGPWGMWIYNSSLNGTLSFQINEQKVDTNWCPC